jgi:tol-pal system protein YbgF
MKKASRSIFLSTLLILFSCVLGASCSSLPFFGGRDEPVQEPSRKEADPLELERLTHSLEDVRQDRDKKEKTIRELENKIQALEQQVRDLEKQNAQKPSAVYKLEYVNPVELYSKARNLLLEGNAADAAGLFNEFAKRHPDHSLADNALYWLGECHYTLGRYPQAVEEFKRLIQTYPKAEKVPDALLKIGYSYLSVDDVNRAGHYLKQVLKKYPFSPAAEKAQEKLNSIE